MLPMQQASSRRNFPYWLHATPSVAPSQSLVHNTDIKFYFYFTSIDRNTSSRSASKAESKAVVGLKIAKKCMFELEC